MANKLIGRKEEQKDPPGFRRKKNGGKYDKFEGAERGERGKNLSFHAKCFGLSFTPGIVLFSFFRFAVVHLLSFSFCCFPPFYRLGGVCGLRHCDVGVRVVLVKKNKIALEVDLTLMSLTLLPVCTITCIFRFDAPLGNYNECVAPQQRKTK